jgi:hypothetical protein
MAHVSSTTKQFEQILEDARNRLSTMRDAYTQLEKTEDIPEWVVQSIGDFEREINNLDKNLEITDQDVKIAERTSRRVIVLSGVIEAFCERQRIVAEAAVARVCMTLSDIAKQFHQNSSSLDLSPSVEELQKRCSMLHELIDKERYAQVLQHDHVSPTKLKPEVRELDKALQGEISDSVHVQTHLNIVSKLLDKIHESLAELGDKNDDQTAYHNNLCDIKSKISEAKAELDNNDCPSPERTAEILFNDCLTVHNHTTHAHADQHLVDTFVQIHSRKDFELDCDVSGCEARGDRQTLLNKIESKIASEAELSEMKRLQQLLLEHDGSVARTVEATDYTVDTIAEKIPQLYDTRDVSDLHIEFNR